MSRIGHKEEERLKAIGAKMQIPQRFFLAQDGSCHWYLVDASRRKEWEEWQAIPEDDERSWEAPSFSQMVDGPHQIEFENPTHKGNRRLG